MKELWEKVKEFFLKVDKKVRILLGGAVLAILIVAIIAAFVISSRPYAVLFTGLSSDESQAIVSYLEENGVTDYRLEGSDTIKVPAKNEAKLKASLLMQGYPKSGFAYETYRSAISTMSTESDRNIAYLQDLQDRMASVIRCMDGVKDAVVTISQEEDRRYILDSNNIAKATASIMVTMENGTSLSTQQAKAIRNLVARSVKGLTIENIAISDSLGNTYSTGDESATSGDASLLKLQLEEEVNRSVRTQIMQVLVPLFGENNISVAVNSTVDVRHSVADSTKYTEPEWASDGSTKGEGIIGSKVYDQEVTKDPKSLNGGVAGAESNSDIGTYVQNNVQANGNETYIRNQGEVNYNVNTDKEQIERWAGTVSDVMVSVTINSEAAKGADQANLLDHIARAAGINPDLQSNKISIYLGPFFKDSDTNSGILPDTANLPFPLWMIYAAIGGLSLLLLLLLIFGILRRKKKKKLSDDLGLMLDDAFITPAVPNEAASMDLMTIRTEKSMELRKVIRQFAEENPEIAAYMLKSWLRGGNEQDA
ncbi:MAG: fliF [Paenibacillus sp.]|nr:fliF [Paenibacillus sp.]